MKSVFFYEEILKEFQRKKVKYVLTGGVAVNLQGAFRATADLDILVEMSDENLAKVVKILKKEGYVVRQPVDPMGIANRHQRKDWIKNKHMKAFNFYKDDEYKEVDIIIDSPVSYTEAKKQAMLIKVENLKLPVMSLEHLIKMKKRAGRDQDLLDIKELKLIEKLRGSP